MRLASFVAVTRLYDPLRVLVKFITLLEILSHPKSVCGVSDDFVRFSTKRRRKYLIRVLSYLPDSLLRGPGRSLLSPKQQEKTTGLGNPKGSQILVLKNNLKSKARAISRVS